MRNLNKFFSPNSVAVLGASRDEKKIGHIVLKNIVNSGFRGQIFPINPKAENIIGMDCYKSYDKLPEIPDLAIISLPVELVLKTLESIAKKGTKNVIVFSAGFKEAGKQGEEMERKLRTAAEKLELNILGPNCLGFASTLSSLNATFSRVGGARGNLRFMSQSGALASGIFDWAKQNNIGFSEFITLGNKAVLNENDILRYWLGRQAEKNEVGLSKCQPVGMYLESLDAGKEFLELASKVSAKDPIFILKPGKSKQAQKAIRSHTGSMAGDDAVQDAAFDQAGIIRCEGVEDMFDLAKVFSWENAPRGPKVAVVSNAGGPAVISTDAIEKEGLQLATLSQKTLNKLSKNLPRAASVLNPVDVLGDALADRYQEAIADVLAEKGVDALVVILTPQVMTQIEATADLIGKLSAKYGKPIVCSFMGGNIIDKGEEILNKYKIPSFRFPERAIKALAKMWQWENRKKTRKLKIENRRREVASKNNTKLEKIINSVEKNTKVLPAVQADAVLNLFGIKTPPSQNVHSLAEAQEFVEKHRWPVVLKISSPELIHKTEAGAVIKNIHNDEQLEKAGAKMAAIAKKLKNKSSTYIQIQTQVGSGVEVIAGVKYDASFGNILMFGAGGILAELIGDSNLKMLPIDEAGARQLIAKSKVSKLLTGFRNQKSFALNKLATLLVKLGNLAQSTNCFSEITINPIIVTERDAWAVDPRIILK